MRNHFTLDDQGAVVLSIQIQTIRRRPTLVDQDGYDLADSPGPHAPVHGARVPIDFIVRRLPRRTPRRQELQP